MLNYDDIDTLINLDGMVIEQENGYWTKFEARAEYLKLKKYRMEYAIA